MDIRYIGTDVTVLANPTERHNVEVPPRHLKFAGATRGQRLSDFRVRARLLRRSAWKDYYGSPGAVAAYFDLLHDTSFLAPPNRLPDNGVGLLTEKLLSARFVRMGVYGTRSSTVLRMRYDRVVRHGRAQVRPLPSGSGESRFTTMSAPASGP